MRIAILTSARTGSTSTFRLIEKHIVVNGYKCISEPFNHHWRDKVGLTTYDIPFFEKEKNVFIKTFVSKNQTPKFFEENYENYWNWFFKYFDKVILLDRKDKILQSESLAYHIYKDAHLTWQSKQYYDLSNISLKTLEDTKLHLEIESNIIHSHMDKGYPLFYFEDIYIQKDKAKVIEMFNYIGLELNDSFYEEVVLSDTYKLRLNAGESRFKTLI